MSTGVRNSTHGRVPSGDIEMGIMEAGPAADFGLIDEKKQAPETDEASNKSCSQRCCESIRPRDWSEYLIVPGGLTAIGFGVFHALQDSNEWLAAPSFAVGLICMLAEVRVRQLWITKTLDMEAQDFDKSNDVLQGRVRELEASKEALEAANVALKENVVSFSTENDKFKEQNDKLQADLEAREKQVGEMQVIEERLKKDLAAVRSSARAIDDALDHKGDEVEDTGEISELEKQLAALRKAKEAERIRHQTAMGERVGDQ